jgi:hypothetical protein
MTFEYVETLPAGTPGLLHHSEGGDMTFTGTGVAVSPTADINTETSVAGWTWNGVYQSTVLDATAAGASNYYYVANDKFYHASSSLTVNPFRAYFAYSGSAAVAERFNIRLDDSAATGIHGLDAGGASLLVLTDKGQLTLVAQADTRFVVAAVNGAVVAQGSLQAGDTKTMTVASGIYVVNGRKVYVK